MLASRWYRKGEEHTYTKGFAGRFDKSFFAFEELYRNTLRHILKHPYIAVLIGNAILVAAAYFIGPQLGFRFVPGQDTNQVAVTIEAPDGASLDYTRKICAQISQIVRSTPSLNNDIKFITTRLGRAGGGGGGLGSQFTGTQYGTVTLTLYDRKSVIDNFTGTKEHLRNRSDVDVATELRKVTAKIAGAQLITAEISGTGSGAAIQIRLNGSEFPKIMGVAQQVLDIVRKEPGTTDTDISYKNSEPEVQVRVDRNKAPEFGLQSSDIANALSTAFEGNTNTEYRDPIDTQQYYINIINSLSSRSSASQVGDVIVGYYNNAPVYLKQVADLTVGTGPVKIDHINRERNVTISAYLRNGYEVGNVTQSILAKANKLNLGNVSVTTGGEAQRMGDEFGFMAEAFILGIVLSYLLMAALFNNLLYPFSILLSLPQAWVGAMLALWISKLPFSLIAGIGIVMLNGIVQKNAILLVDYANGLRRKGYERNDALIATGPLRLRPIMMTTIAIVVSSLPTALALGRGAQFRQALGITVIGGVLVALMLTLLIVPCAYVVWDDIGTLFVRIKEHLNSQRIRDMETSMENDLSSDEVDDKDDQ
jgi:HAE1 family hydrophobic/amphiphilic exporter-1